MENLSEQKRIEKFWLTGGLSDHNHKPSIVVISSVVVVGISVVVVGSSLVVVGSSLVVDDVCTKIFEMKEIFDELRKIQE